MIRKCTECGTEFKCSPSHKKVTCSKECSRKRRSKTLKGRKVSKETRKKLSEASKGRDMSNLQIKGTLAAQNSTKSGRYETNSSAKYWELLSPDKKIYRFTNLREWLRNNIEEQCGLEATDENITKVGHGFNTIKRNLKRKQSTITYKDWTILYWENENNYEKRRKKQ